MFTMYKILFFICLITVTGVSNARNDFPPTPFEVEYSLYRKGAKIAKVNRRLIKLEKGHYEYHSETKTTGLVSLFRKDHIVEKSALNFYGEILRPQHYSYVYSGSKKKRDVSIEFDWKRKKIKNTINGDFWHMPAEPAVMDKLLYQLAIMHDLKNGRTPTAYQIADGGKIKIYHFEKLGEEMVKTPLGDYNTIKMVRHRPNSQRKSIFWCAIELEYLPIKVEHMEKDGGTTKAVIKSLQGISY